ncbi:MAG TPA: SGNH/GDSL hydrolase family protein [Armatimonadota bacterium]|nr:SGNH/GDSL hydrolase family protein [Armatimonadota bacterium]
MPLPHTARLLHENTPLRVVCYGDSISEVGRSANWYGGATCREANWGIRLAGLLRAAYPGAEITVRHFGIGGQNAYEGLGRLDGLAAYTPDLVLVAFGANDTGWHPLPPEATQLALHTIAQWTTERYGADVMLMSTGGDNPLRPKHTHVAETVQATRDAAAAAGAGYVDIRAAVLRATEHGTRWTDYHNGPQDCHPNDAGHRLWAETVFAALQAALTGR